MWRQPGQGQGVCAQRGAVGKQQACVLCVCVCDPYRLLCMCAHTCIVGVELLVVTTKVGVAGGGSNSQPESGTKLEG